MIELPFVGPSYTLKSLSVDSQSSFNCYPDLVQSQNGKAQYVLKRTPGLTLRATLNGTQSVRGLYKTSTGRLFGVCGAVVNEVLTDHTVLNHGSINSGLTPASSTPVSFSDNGVQLIIVDGVTGYIFNLETNTLTAISDADFIQTATHVDYIDGRFLINEPDSGRFWWSAIDDGTSWNGLDFATAEGSPDILEGLIVSRRRILLLGSQSNETWTPTGTSSVFSRQQGTLNDIGTIAKYSIAKNDNSVFWLGSNDTGFGQVWMQTGFESVKISTSAIDEAIQGYPETSDAIGFCYQQDGNSFYQISFPEGNKTWVYDTTTRLWHERSYKNTSNGDAERHRASCQAFFNGRVYVGDKTNGKLYSYDADVYTDNGDTIIVSRTTPHYWNNLDRLFFKSFQIDMETGVGVSTGQGSAPEIMLENSNDGGHTFEGEQVRSIGALGKYTTRVRWERQGSARDRVVRVTVSDPVSLTFLNAHVELG